MQHTFEDKRVGSRMAHSRRTRSHYVCVMCGKAFMRLAALENHERLIHAADGDDSRHTANDAHQSDDGIHHSADDTHHSDDSKNNSVEGARRNNKSTPSKKPTHQGIMKLVDICKSSKDGSYKCANCKVTLDKLDHLFEHNCDADKTKKGKRAEKSYTCSDCGSSGACQCSARSFRIIVEEKSVVCNLCSDYFPDKMSLNIHKQLHLKQAHDASLAREAQDQKQVSTSKLLTGLANEPNHMKCEQCNKVFKNNLYLNEHMMTHGDLKQFDCYYCQLTFPTAKGLKQHLLAEHEQDSEACMRPGADVIETPVGTRYRCCFCTKHFTCRSNRRRHEQWHFNLRPFKCEICMAAFRQRWQLQKHRQAKRCKRNRRQLSRSSGNGRANIQAITPNGIEIDCGSSEDHGNQSSVGDGEAILENSQKIPDVLGEQNNTQQNLHSGKKVSNIYQALNQANGGADNLGTEKVNAVNSCTSHSGGIDNRCKVILKNIQKIPDVPAEIKRTQRNLRSGQKVSNICQTLQQANSAANNLGSESANAAKSTVCDSGSDDKLESSQTKPGVPAGKTRTRQSLRLGQKLNNICQMLTRENGVDKLSTDRANTCTANSCASESSSGDKLENSQKIPCVPAERTHTRQNLGFGQNFNNICHTPNKANSGANKLTTELANAANTCTCDSSGIDDKFKIVSDLPAETPIDLTLIKSLLAKKRSNQTYSCKDCGQICKSSRNLVIHRRIHTGERPYPCSKCNLTFRQSHHRKIHMRAKHGITLESSQVTKQEIVVVTKEGIRYKCHYCSKMLMSRSGRRKHERWHLGLRPHKCDNCGESFKQSQHLQKHKMSRRCKSDQDKTATKLRKKSKDPSGMGGQEYSESGSSDAVIALVTPLNLATKETTVGVTHEANNNNTCQGDININSANASVPYENPQQCLDMPSALGLISTDLLKTKSSTNPFLTESRSLVSAQDSSDMFTDESAFPPSAGEGVLPIKDEPSNGSNEDLEYYMKIKEESDGERCENGNLRTDTKNLLYNRPNVGGSPLDVQMDVSPNQSDAEMLAMADNAVTNYEPSALTVINGNQSRSSTTENDRELDANSDKRHQCPECGQYYKSRQNLGIHMRMHTGERPHMCTLCSKTFIQPHHLKAHMKSQHAILMVTPAKPVRQEEILLTPDGLRFKCQHCPKLLTSKNGRQKHERWHLGLRPHKCEVCGKSFKQSHHLKRHKVGNGCMPQMQEMQNQTSRSCPGPVENGTYAMILPSSVLVPGSNDLPANPVPGFVPTVPGLLIPQLASGVVGVVAAAQPNTVVALSQAIPLTNAPQSQTSIADGRAATSIQ